MRQWLAMRHGFWVAVRCIALCGAASECGSDSSTWPRQQRIPTRDMSPRPGTLLAVGLAGVLLLAGVFMWQVGSMTDCSPVLEWSQWAPIGVCS